MTMDEESSMDIEAKYAKRIQELENENLQLLETFEALQRENKLLRTKYEETASGDVISEPYDVVNAERIALRAKVEKYKKHIDALEKERTNMIRSLQEYGKTCQDSKILDVTGIKKRKIIVDKRTESVNAAREDNKILFERITALERDRDSLGNKIKNLESTIVEVDRGKQHIRNIPAIPNQHVLKISKSSDTFDKPSNYFISLPEIRTATSTPSFLSTYVEIYRRKLSRMVTDKRFTPERGTRNK